jgi:hypothetical protein
VWFALGHKQPYRVPVALFVPTRGTLGRREIRSPAGVRLEAEALGAERLHELRVSSADVTALRRRLDERFAAGAAAVPAPVHRDGLAFVPDRETYWVAHQCNSVVAGWLRELGCRVSWPVLMSGFRLERPGAAPHSVPEG